jgi:hypothetical protein
MKRLFFTTKATKITKVCRLTPTSRD